MQVALLTDDPPEQEQQSTKQNVDPAVYYVYSRVKMEAVQTTDCRNQKNPTKNWSTKYDVRRTTFDDKKPSFQPTFFGRLK
jgi:hypothetical protein